MKASITFIGIVISSLALMFSQVGRSKATICPWKNWRGSNFLEVKPISEQEKYLTADQVREDLDCLHTILTNVYAYKNINSDHAISKRLADLSGRANSVSNLDFVDQIFSIHTGFVDAHLSEVSLKI